MSELAALKGSAMEALAVVSPLHGTLLKRSAVRSRVDDEDFAGIMASDQRWSTKSIMHNARARQERERRAQAASLGRTLARSALAAQGGDAPINQSNGAFPTLAEQHARFAEANESKDSPVPVSSRSPLVRAGDAATPSSSITASRSPPLRNSVAPTPPPGVAIVPSSGYKKKVSKSKKDRPAFIPDPIRDSVCCGVPGCAGWTLWFCFCCGFFCMCGDRNKSKVKLRIEARSGGEAKIKTKIIADMNTLEVSYCSLWQLIGLHTQKHCMTVLPDTIAS